MAPMKARSFGSNPSGAATIRGPDGSVDAGGLAPIQGDEEVVLVGEVLVDERPGHPGPLGNHAHRDAAGPDLVHQGPGHVEQRLAALVGREPLGDRHRDRRRRRWHPEMIPQQLVALRHRSVV